MPNAVSQRNPPWQRDELILALDLYFRIGRRVPDDSEPEVIALSTLLNELPIHSSRPDATRFRNPNGVALKLANLRSLDQPGHGMDRGGKLDQVVWDEFASDVSRLHAVANAIAAGHRSVAAASPAPGRDEDEEAFPEGRVLFRLHRGRERSPALIRAKKAEALLQHGRLACEVCAFDFGQRYGAHGVRFIECHHTVPISTLAPGAKTRVQDVVLLCSNCHRMVHRRRPWLALADMHDLLVT